MNAERRKAIEAASAMVEAAFATLEEARSAIQDLIDEEQAYLDNMPESLQAGARGEAATDAIGALQCAHDEIDSFVFDSVFNSLDEAGQ